MSWLLGLAAVIAVVALLYLPGLATCWLAGLRSLGLVALAPAVTLAIAGIGAVLAGFAHVPWSLLTLLAATVIACAIAALLAWRWPIVTPRRLPRWSRRQWGMVAGAAGAAILAVAIPAAIGMRGPAAVLQKWDAVYHLNLVEYIRQTGRGSTLGAGAISNTVSQAFYPAAWHDVIALVPTQIPTVIAVNAGTAVCAIGVWVVSHVYLARVVFPAQPAYAATAAVLAAIYRAGPISMWSHDAHLPNVMGLALLPALLAWTVQLARVIKIRSIGRGTRLVVLAAALGGACLAHPNSLFSYLVLALPVFGFIVVTVVRRLWASHRQWLAVTALAVLALILAAGAYVIFSRPEVQSVMAFDQPVRTFALGALGIGLIDTMSGWAYGPGILMGVLQVTGLVVTLRGKRRRWLAISFGLTLFLYVAAAGDLVWLRVFTGLWYSDSARLAALIPVAGIPLAVIGAATLWRLARTALPARAKLERIRGYPGAKTTDAYQVGTKTEPGTRAAGRSGQWTAVLAAAALAIGVLDAAFLLGTRSVEFAGAYPATDSPLRPLFLDPAEEAMIARLPGELDRTKAVLGDPFAGTAFLYSLAGQPVIFTHVAGTWDEDREYLAAHFGQIRTDPEVCRILTKLNAGYFYADPRRYGDALAYPGLDYGIEPEGIMERVDTSGLASIYRITACDAGQAGARN